jgi:hypothetical protein
LYESLLRNGYVLPAYHSALCNHQFLLDIKLGRVFCFREQDVSYKNMVHKLSAKDLNTRLRDKLEDSLLMHDYWKNPENKKKVQELIYRLEERQADAHYCVLILSTLHCNGATCEIFEKNWKPVAKVAEEQASFLPENDDGFFDGLPDLDKKQMQRKGNVPKTKAQRLEE